MRKKVILVTGCSTGIGYSLVKKLAQQGHKVYAGVRKPEVISELRRDNLKPIRLDVNNQEDIVTVIADIERECGHLDLLVNNAGYGAMGPLVEMPMSEVREQFKTNVFSVLALTQLAFPLLHKAALKNQSALIINVGSVSGVMPTPFSGAYCATKAAVHAMSDALRMELAPLGIEVMTVQPGAIESSFGDTAVLKLADTLAKDSIYSSISDGIRKRAGASQDNPTTADEFVDVLLEAINKNRKPANIRIGNGSFVMPLLKRLLPESWLDFILSRSFSLHLLASNKQL